mgnify:CR=1 FL=1
MALDYIIPEFEVVRNDARCTRCRICESQCANGVHTYNADGKVMVSDESKCVNCQRCVSFCPTHAIKIVKNDNCLRENANWSCATIKEIYKQASTGGVLLSSMGNPQPLPVYWDRILINASQVTNPPIDPLREPMETRVFLGKKPEDCKFIICHLGNGSSIAAVDQGKVVDTSMGMTPLAGLMMGTRCGDLDPSVVNYLKYTLNITGHELDEILNKKSGLLGISGVSSDKRDVEEAAAAGNKRAQLASDMLNYQIKKTIGSYIAAMGGVDAIVFTGGIGEHDAIARAKICHHMDWLGIRVDTDKNANAHKQNKDVVEITAWGAKVRTLVIETNEELMIARDTKEVIEK